MIQRSAHNMPAYSQTTHPYKSLPVEFMNSIWLTEMDHERSHWFINSSAPMCLVQINLRCTFLFLFSSWFCCDSDRPSHLQEICWAFSFIVFFVMAINISNRLPYFSYFHSLKLMCEAQEKCFQLHCELSSSRIGERVGVVDVCLRAQL